MDHNENYKYISRKQIHNGKLNLVFAQKKFDTRWWQHNSRPEAGTTSTIKRMFTRLLPPQSGGIDDRRGTITGNMLHWQDERWRKTVSYNNDCFALCYCSKLFCVSTAVLLLITLVFAHPLFKYGIKISNPYLLSTDLRPLTLSSCIGLILPSDTISS